jgi:hypothetical protein
MTEAPSMVICAAAGVARTVTSTSSVSSRACAGATAGATARSGTGLPLWRVVPRRTAPSTSAPPPKAKSAVRLLTHGAGDAEAAAAMADSSVALVAGADREERLPLIGPERLLGVKSRDEPLVGPSHERFTPVGVSTICPWKVGITPERGPLRTRPIASSMIVFIFLRSSANALPTNVPISRIVIVSCRRARCASRSCSRSAAVA